jgi:hypothetical protein
MISCDDLVMAIVAFLFVIVAGFAGYQIGTLLGSMS